MGKSRRLAGRLTAASAALLVAVAALLATLSTFAQPIKNSACLDCHSDKTLFKTNAAHQAVWLFIDEAKFRSAVHKTNSCANCHSDLTTKHPDDDVPAKPVNCAQCHEPQAKEYAASIHGVSHQLGA